MVIETDHHRPGGTRNPDWIQNYIDNDLYPAEDDGRYAWGQESVLIAAHISADDD